MNESVVVRAYAKINLCLSIGAPASEGPKAGFHPIASWMQCVDLFDEVVMRRLTEGEKSTCVIRWAGDAPRVSAIDWEIEKDLGVKAHRAIEAATGRVLPVAMELVKRIPVGGGLGGGSADAAAVMLGVMKLFGIELAEEKVREVAMSLGSDVVFFADVGRDVARAALVTGFGDGIRRVEGVEGELVLVVPPYGCATGPVYRSFDEMLKERMAAEAVERAVRGHTGKEKQTGAKEPLVEARWERMAERGRIEGEHLFNDLAVPAYRVEARLGKLVTALSNATREQAHVTGSGSCVFIPVTAERAGRMLERVEKLLASTEEFAGARAMRVRLLGG